MKKIFLIAFLLLAVNAFSQTSVTTETYRGGFSYLASFTDLDSTVSAFYSEWFDVSAIDAQTVYLASSFVGGADAADTLVVVYYGKLSSILTMKLGQDTLVSSTAGTVTQKAITLTYKMPMFRFQLLPKGTNTDNVDLYLGVYTTGNDPMYDRVTYGKPY